MPRSPQIINDTKLSLASLCLLLTCISCASLPASAVKFNNFSDYAEAVFKHQNQVISRMMMLNDNEQLPDSDELDNQEQVMQDACRLLNEYAEMEIDGDFISPFFTRTVQNSIEGCDLSIKKWNNCSTRLTQPPILRVSRHSSKLRLSPQRS